MVFGVLGGVASGKSAVAARLAGPRGVVVDADALAGEALDDPRVRARIARAFGPQALGPDGRTRREVLAERVFRDPEARSRLEGWIHPIVRERILAALARAAQQAVERLVLEVALLLENDGEHGLVARCDHLVFVDAPAAVRDRRAVENRGWAPGEVLRREAAQLSLDEKRRRAHYVVRNDGTPEQLDARVDEVLADVGLG